MSWQKSQELARSIMASISRSLNPEETFQEIVKAAVERLGFAVAYLTLYDKQNEVLQLRSIYPRDERLERAREILQIDPENFTFPVSPELTPHFARYLEGEMAVCGSFWELVRPHLPKKAVDAIQALYGVKKIIHIPLQARGRLLGSLLAAATAEEIGQRQLELLQLLATGAAIAIDNARLYQEERRRAKREAVLAAVGRALSRSLTPEDFLTETLNGLLQALELELGAVYLIEGDEFILRVQRGLSPEFARLAERNPLDHPVLGRAIQSDKPLEVHEFSAPETKKEGIQHAAYLPLTVQEGPLGVLIIGDRKGRALTREELELLETVGSQLSLALRQVEAQSRIRHWRKLSQEILENAPLGILRLDREGRIVYENPAMRELLGVPQERSKALGMKITELPNVVETGIVSQLEALLAGRRIGKLEVPFTSLYGKKAVLSVEGIPLIDEAGEQSGAMLLVQDVTRLKESEQLRGSLLEVAEEILASHDVERILRRAVQAVVDHSPFQRAAVSLYDTTAEQPLESPVTRICSAGLTEEEEQQLIAEGGMPPRYRRAAFSEQFRIGNSYYVPHDRLPWGPEAGVAGTVELDGWHPEDFLFIPLRGERGIIGHISVDDPRIPQAVNVDVLEPMEVFAGLAALAVERAARMEELQQHKEWLHGAYQIGQELVRYRTQEELFTGVLEILKEELHYDYGAVMLQQGDQLVVEALETTFADREIDLGDRIPLEQGISGWVARHRKPALVNDVTQDPRYVMGHQAIRSELAVPIQLGEELFGVLNIESNERNRFKVEDQEFLSSVAAQLAVALAELRSRQQLERAYRLGQALVEIEAQEELISLVLNWLHGQFRYDYGTVLLKEEGRLRLAGYTVKEGSQVSRKEIELGKGIIGWAGDQRQSSLVNDVREDPRYVAAWEGVRSELAVPIHTPEELFGVLDIQSEQPGYFTEQHRQVVESIAGQMAIALSNIKRQEKLKEASIRDPLTGLYNRRYFNEIVERELERSRRYKHYLTLLMVDLDDFRRVNNVYGHRKGDEVLCQIAELLRKNVRSSDMVFRYGGDEFLILMPETDSEAANAVKRLQQMVEEWNSGSGLDFPLGLSIGVSSWSPQDGRRIEEVLEEADQRLYQAKTREGR